jgi:AcrR family transcriptional regulator
MNEQGGAGARRRRDAAALSRGKAKRARRNRESSPREQLLEAAGAFMTERGTTDVSLSEIAERSGLNSALVKYYFGRKSGLLMELLRKAMEPGLGQLQHLLDSDNSPADKLRIHISGIVTTYIRYPYVNRLMHQVLSDYGEEYGATVAEEFARPVYEAQRRILEEGERLGYFRAVDPMLFYFHITGACDNLFHQHFARRYVFGVENVDEDLRRDFVDHLYGLVMHGLGLGIHKSGGPDI